nr:aldo/keto reductase [Marinicella sp. NBU2979]
MGCASYWGQKYFSEKKAIQVVHRALELGINYFDTGHSYSGGHAEVRLGLALQQYAGSLSPVISSKVGTRVGHLGRLDKDFSPQWIRQSCEQSLRQLRLEQLPLLFLHGPNPEDFNDDTYQVLAELQAAGKVGLVGVNAFDDHIIQLAADSGQFHCIMLDHNILSQHRAQTIAQLTAQNLDVVVAGAIAGGLYDRRFKRFRGMKSVWYWLRAWKNNRALLQRARRFAFLNDQPTGTATQWALAYVLQLPAVKSALIGTTSVAHVEELVQAADLTLPSELLAAIEAQANSADTP